MNLHLRFRQSRTIKHMEEQAVMKTSWRARKQHSRWQQDNQTHLPHTTPRDQVTDDGRVEAHAGDQRRGAHAGELATELWQQRQIRRTCVRLRLFAGWLPVLLYTTSHSKAPAFGFYSQRLHLAH